MLKEQFPVRAIDGFAGPSADGFDLCLYQMGNNIRYHAKIYKTLRRFPGMMTLHDVNLHSFYGELFLKQNQPAGYAREMAYGYGHSGIKHARRLSHGDLRDHKIQHYPLFERVVQSSLGVVVHSRFAYRSVNSRCPQTPIAHIPHLQEDLSTQLLPPDSAKAKLGLAPGSLLLASFGYIAPSKRIEVALRACAHLFQQFPQLNYALVGQIAEGYNLRVLLSELNLENRVQLVGYAGETTFQTYLSATDIGINLRYPSLGETSGTLLRLMGAAKPVLVSNVDAFAELPDDACIKISVNDQEQEAVETALMTLIADETLRRQMGRQALTYIRHEGDPLVAAGKYIQFAERLLGGP